MASFKTGHIRSFVCVLVFGFWVFFLFFVLFWFGFGFGFSSAWGLVSWISSVYTSNSSLLGPTGWVRDDLSRFQNMVC